MKKKNKTILITSIFTFVIIVISCLVLYISFQRVVNTDVSLDIQENVDKDENTESLLELETKNVTTEVDVKKSIFNFDKDIIIDEFEVENTKFTQIDNGFEAKIYEILPKEAAEIYLNEVKRLFPDTTFVNDFVIYYCDETDHETSVGIWVLYMLPVRQQGISVPPSNVAYIDSVTGNIIKLINYNNPIEYIKEASKKSFSQYDFAKIVNIDNIGSIARTFLHKYDLDLGEATLKDAKLDFSMTYIGVVIVSHTIGNKDNAIKVKTYIDYYTFKVVGYEYLSPDNAYYKQY